MARMATQQDRAKRARRQFTDEFKAGAVRLVLDDGKTIAEVARDLDLTPSSLAGWVKQARADRSGGKTGLTTDERAELAKLRKEDGELKRERELLKKWAAFFAKEAREVRVHRGGEGVRGRGVDVRSPGRVGVGLLRVAQAVTVDAGEEGRAAQGAHQGRVRGEPQDIRQPACARRST